jgi:hypothetical protein
LTWKRNPKRGAESRDNRNEISFVEKGLDAVATLPCTVDRLKILQSFSSSKRSFQVKFFKNRRTSVPFLFDIAYGGGE